MPRKKGGTGLSHDMMITNGLNFSISSYKPFDYTQINDIKTSNFVGGTSIINSVKKLYTAYMKGEKSNIKSVKKKGGFSADKFSVPINMMKDTSNLTTYKQDYKGVFPTTDHNIPYSKFGRM